MGREGNGKGSLFQGLKRSVLRDILHVYAVRCSRMPQRTNQGAAVRALIVSRSSKPVSAMRSTLCCSYGEPSGPAGCQPQSQRGRISGTHTNASHAFRPITSIRRSIRAVAQCFGRLS
jgi:hypothetical protein